MKSRTMRVLLADDHPRVRAGMRNILEKAPDIEVVGEAGDGLQTLEMVEKFSPDVLLLDMEMPFLNGSQVASKLHEKKSSVKILVLSAHDNQQYIQDMLELGVSGYLIKDEVPETLVEAVRGVARGEKNWVSQRVAAKLAKWKAKLDSERVTLTLREREVISQVVARKSNREIAQQLSIPENMVEKHLQLLFTKLDVKSRRQLGMRAVEEGLV